MSFAFCDGIHVAAHSDQAPSDAEWRAYLDDIAVHLADMTGILTFGRGPGPNLLQRSAANRFWEQHTRKPIAVLTDSKLVRGAVIAFSWMMDQQIRAFPLGDFEGALGFLDVPSERGNAIEAVLLQLQRETCGDMPT